MKDLKRKIAAILILALVFNTNAMWTFADSNETFKNLEETSAEEKSTQYVEESLTIETSETSIVVAGNDNDSGDNNIGEKDESLEDESIIEEEPEEDEIESNEVPTEPEEDESESSETHSGIGENEIETTIAESESETNVGASSTSANNDEIAEESIASPSDVEDEDGARETRPYDVIASASETEFLEEVPIASLSEVVGFDDKLLGAAGDAYMQRRLFFDLDGHGTTASGKPAANLKKIIIQIGGDIPEGFNSFGSIGYVYYYDKGTDDDFEVLLYADGVSFTNMHIGTAGLFKDLINLEEIEGFEVVGTGELLILKDYLKTAKNFEA